MFYYENTNGINDIFNNENARPKAVAVTPTLSTAILGLWDGKYPNEPRPQMIAISEGQALGQYNIRSLDDGTVIFDQGVIPHIPAIRVVVTSISYKDPDEEEEGFNPLPMVLNGLAALTRLNPYVKGINFLGDAIKVAGNLSGDKYVENLGNKINFGEQAANIMEGAAKQIAEAFNKKIPELELSGSGNFKAEPSNVIYVHTGETIPIAGSLPDTTANAESDFDFEEDDVVKQINDHIENVKTMKLYMCPVDLDDDTSPRVQVLRNIYNDLSTAINEQINQLASLHPEYKDHGSDALPTIQPGDDQATQLSKYNDMLQILCPYVNQLLTQLEGRFTAMKMAVMSTQSCCSGSQETSALTIPDLTTLLDKYFIDSVTDPDSPKNLAETARDVHVVETFVSGEGFI